MDNNFTHTKAAGTEPFDHEYGVGYQVHHKDWSPFPRINRLRKQFLARPYDIDLDRLRLVTKSYKEHVKCPTMLKVAYAFREVLENETLHIDDEELIAGDLSAAPKDAPIYPEFSVDWIIDEAYNHPFEKREHDQFYFKSDEDRAEAVELCKWWQGQTVADEIESRLSYDQLKCSEAGKKIFQTNLYHYAGVGHLAADYAYILRRGFDGIIEDISAQQKLLDMHDPYFADKRDTYDAMIICMNAAKIWTKRYADLAAKMAEETKDAKRKAELETMVANLNQVAGGPAKSFWQALQLFNIATVLIQTEGNGHSISYGRMDQWLYPYYKADLDAGKITKEFALELIEDQYVKLNYPTKLKDFGSMAVRNGRGFGGESLTIGGVDRDGNDATNDLTMLFLEATAHTRMMNPWLCVRFHEKTPYELYVKTAEVIRVGCGHPKLYNDGPAIKACLRKGFSLEDAREYCVVGCVEIDVPGKEYGWHDAAYVNTAKMMEMVLNGGKFLDDDKTQYGPNTGSLLTYKSFDEVLESVDQQFEYWTNLLCSSENIIDRAHQNRKPLPYVSCFFQNCIRTGKDLAHGGAEVNGIGPQASGLGTCADSLATIKQLMFDEKKVTGAELLQAIKDNWKGHEKLYALVNSSKVHHYGNDDDYADALFKYMFECYCRHIAGRKNQRGGEFSPGVYSVNANVAMGMATNASLDGRTKGEAISDNMGPVHTDGGSHDIQGPTALTNSLTKVDHSLATNGTLMNMKFTEDTVAGITGRDNLVNFIRQYMADQAMHVQFNIMSSATMRAAQKHPEDYKDMLVRVAGYSAYFVELGKKLQKDLIQRTELHF